MKEYYNNYEVKSTITSIVTSLVLYLCDLFNKLQKVIASWEEKQKGCLGNPNIVICLFLFLILD